ncbi:GNAT family N-acetyltransferase [Saccharothrix obliqua]|uniref:GNAT family N-acetyltransferase n=1 Tax=Saccharothrix obliqua TaxID=2861747 RepID=UPI001C5F1EFC|nr:GNAT family protein [Saccharothrix obliqua]MBW4719644.1 GNAT family N-acetyltransferase [Saccharothrix obliqua]
MTNLTYPDPLGDGVISVRPWRDSDLPCVEQASQDPRIPQGTTVPVHYTPEAGLAYIARQHARLTSGQGWSLAIARQDTDEAVGHINLMLRPQQGVAGIGYWIVPAARRQGIGSRAIALMTAWGLGAGNFARIEAWVEPDNHASQQVLEMNGYLLEGKLRSFLDFGTRRADVLVYSRITSDAEG